ncbi:tetratricopeptide repeat protein, partial [bacterium]|nr:tetratricopeptide repeat protein [bacterium]
MDFGVLTLPLTMLSIAFGFAVFTDTQSIHFEYVDVPEHIAVDSGYTPAVVIARVADEMKDISKQANTTAGARQVDLGGGHSAGAVLGEYVGVTPLIRVVQQSMSLIPFTFAGEIVKHDDHLEMKMRGHGAEHHAAEFEVQSDQ